MRNDNVTIIGTGSYLPKTIMTNELICEKIDTTPEWIEEKLGIKERRFGVDETTADMAYNATLEALKDANVDKEELDLIIVVSSSPDQISPSTASILHNMLNIVRDVPSFDINAVCAGFVYAMTFASTLISKGVYEKILIVASERYSAHTKLTDRNCVFFGDGSGAIVLGKSNNGWLVSHIASNGKETGMTGFRMSLDAPFKQKGREVWNQAVRVLPESMKEVLKEAELTANDINLLLPHQPSINILKLVGAEIGLPIEKIKTIMEKYGNIASASIPIALDDAMKKDEIKKGDKLLFTAVGAGWAWGSMILNYED